MGAIAYGITRIFGENNAAGPIVVLALLLTAIGFMFARRFRTPAGPVIARAEA
jgi:hypothetical protein